MEKKKIIIALSVCLILSIAFNGYLLFYKKRMATGIQSVFMNMSRVVEDIGLREQQFMRDYQRLYDNEVSLGRDVENNIARYNASRNNSEKISLFAAIVSGLQMSYVSANNRAEVVIADKDFLVRRLQRVTRGY